MAASCNQQITMHHLQEEIDAVVAYGLEQHRINLPHLYQESK